MPYIKQTDRKYVEVGSDPMNAGELNYAIHLLLQKYLITHTENYQTYNDIVGVLECVKQELYRRRVAPYEDNKKFENGDIEFYSE